MTSPQPLNLSYTENSVIYFRNSGTDIPGDLPPPVIRKVELSQKQAMRRDENNIRVSSGVKYQLKFRGFRLENVSTVEARLGRIRSEDYKNQRQQYPVSWMSFENEKPIEFFEVTNPNGTPSNSNGENSDSSNPVSPSSTSSQIVQNGEQTMKIVFSLKKFSDIKKQDKSLPPAKKITFVLSIRFANWEGEARVFFKFSTRSKAESSKEWKIEKILDSDQHPHFIELFEPLQQKDEHCDDSHKNTSQQGIPKANRGVGEGMSSMMNSFVSSQQGFPSSPQSQVPSNSSPTNFTNLLVNEQPQNQHQQLHIQQLLQQQQMQYQQQQQQLLNAQASLFQSSLYLPPQQNIQQLNLQQQLQQPNLESSMNQQSMFGFSMPWNPEFPESKPIDAETATRESRKRNRDSFTHSIMEMLEERPTKRRQLEDQLESLSQDAGPARKAHKICGFGSFSCLRAPVHIFFGSKIGSVALIQKDVIHINVPSHEPTGRPVNVILQNSERLPISSFVQYRFVEADDTPDPSPLRSAFDNYTFEDFDFNIESLLSSDVLSMQYQSLDTLGQSVLHHVAYHGHSRSLLHLLSNGYSPLYKDFLGRTPFHIACAKGNVDCAKILLVFGGRALLFEEDVYGMTGLDLASSLDMDLLVAKIKEFVSGKRAREKFFDDVEIYLNNWPSLKLSTPWEYDKEGNECTNDSNLSPLEIRNRQLEQEIESSRRKLSIVQVATRQRFISRLRRESENSRVSREIEALLPALEEDEPIPEIAEEIMANSSSNKQG